MAFFEQVMNWCYMVCGNYGIAIILFTFLSKIVLLPLSVWVQKNSIKMVKMQPEINEMKVRLFGDKDAIAEEQLRIYKKAGYHPLASIIPMAIQLFLLVGVIEAVKAGIANPEISMDFFGFDLGGVPASAGGKLIWSPFIAGGSAWLLCVAQNMSNVLQMEQSKANKYGMLLISVGLSLYLGWFVPVGVAVYWIASNLFAILQLYLLNWAINPKKHVDYTRLENSKKQLAELEKLGAGRRKAFGDPLAKRERADYKRFFSIVNKHVVFYSESSGFFKYYRGIIEYLLENTNLVIHYVTSDPLDAVFEISRQQPKLKAYYIGEKKLITLMMKMDADIVIMTMPDLENYHIKRSYVRKDIEYIYIPHGMDSLNMTMRKGSMDHYDTIFCVGRHQKEEIEKTEEIYGLPHKKLIEWGYCLLDQMRKEYTGESGARADIPMILIAPSWQPDNIVDSCLEEILDCLKASRYHIVVRPHPQHVKHKGEYMHSLQQKYQEDENIEIQTDFSSNSTVFQADLLITDWSGIAYEYAYTTEKPVLFINTPMKVMNPEYQRIGVTPLNILLRNEIGCSLNLDELGQILARAEQLLQQKDLYAGRIHTFVEEYVYGLGDSSEVGAKYIVSSLQDKIKEKRKGEQRDEKN